MGIISQSLTKETCTPLPSLFWLWPQLPLLPLNMATATTSLDTRNLFKDHIQDAKLFGKQSTKQATKKSMRKSANMSRYQSKTPKLNVMLDTKRNVKMNGSALIIPNKKILITVKTRNGNQPTMAAKAFMSTNAEMFPSPDTRIKRNVEPFISKSPLKSLERLPSENALENHPMNTLHKKSGNMISLGINLTVRSLIYTKNGNSINFSFFKTPTK